MWAYKALGRGLFALGLVASLSVAKVAEGRSDDGEGGPATFAINSKYLVDLIESAPSENLEQAHHNIEMVLNHTNRQPYKQIIEALFRRLDTEIKKGNFVPDRKRSEPLTGMELNLVEYIIDIISQISPAEYADKLDAAIKQVTDIAHSDEVTKLAFDQYKQMPEKFEVYSKVCRSNNFRLVALPGEGFSDKELADELKEFRALLENEIKGQPEVVDALVALRQKDLVYGFRTKSPSLWAMGLPGVGKDTTARAYTNAINRDPEAWKTHMYTVSPLVEKADLWSVLGSGTGYVGSENFPPFLDFLVEHSGGRYLKVPAETDQQGKPKSFKIVENENWRPGDYYGPTPETAVLYLDEFHKWSKDIKDLFVKKALEPDGTFRIYNPNGGLDKITVPVTIIIGSNDGISLLASREKNGERFGKPLSYDQMIDKYQRVAHDPNAKSSAILGGGGAKNGSEISKGTSEELYNRVDLTVLMRPLSPENLREIADHKLRLMVDGFSKTTGGFQNVKIEYAPEVVNVIQEYQYVAEDNARPIEKRIETLFQEPLFAAFANGAVKKGENVTVRFNIRKEDNNTYTGIIEFPDKDLKRSIVTVPIRATEANRKQEPPTDEELMVLDLLPEQLKEGVVGQDHAMDRMGLRIKMAEAERGGTNATNDSPTKAKVFLLLGYSSTGKTQTAKQVARVVMKDESALLTISFSQQMTEHDLNEAIYGFKDARGEVVPSEFMKHYDRNAGRVVVALDEAANAPRELLKKLYDFFREPVVTTFADGKSRPMSNVYIVMTGNAGQEEYAALPAYLPEIVRREAMQEVYRRLASNPNLKREIYLRYFGEPLLARIRDENIFNYGPLDYLAAGKLVQMKMASTLKEIKNPKEGVRGYNVMFKDETAYTKIVDAFEAEGFKTDEQGASIDHFLDQSFKEQLKALLLSMLVPDKADVVLDFGGVEPVDFDKHDQGSMDEIHSNRNKVVLNVTANGQTRQLKLDGIQRSPDVPRLKKEMILTSYHEAGHAIVREALLGEFFKPGGFKVTPGVAHIAGKWTYYAGVASAIPTVRMDTTREFLVREIAVLFGGAVAEDLIVQGGISTHGKQNDMQRATELARRAVLDFGLDDEWGLRNAKYDELSEADKGKVNLIIEKLLKEGQELASEAIRANYQILEALGNEGARTGEVTGAQEVEVFKKLGFKYEMDDGYEQAAKASPLQKTETKRRGVSFNFVSTLKFIDESEIVDPEKALLEKRTDQISQLTVPIGTPFAGVVTPPKPPTGKGSKAPDKNCETLLKGA